MNQIPEDHFAIYHEKDVAAFVAGREGEVKAGEKIHTLQKGENLEALPAYRSKGVRYVLIGVPESVGPMANHGAGGAQNAWDPFLAAFLNMQQNAFLDGSQILCLGHVNMRGLQAETGRLQKSHGDFYPKLRALCGQIDERVAGVAAEVFRANLTPVVIGGGHNNAYPLLKAAAQTLGEGRGVNCINCDPHADFRPLEGRHSGNSFSYARHEGWLNKYAVTGLHRNYNGQAMLEAMEKDPNVYFSFREEESGTAHATQEAVNFLQQDERPTGLEFDMDSLAFMPVSAYTPSGMLVEEARQFIRKATDSLPIAYLHLPEGAPTVSAREDKMVGKSLAFLAADFIHAHRKK